MKAIHRALVWLGPLSCALAIGCGGDLAGLDVTSTTDLGDESGASGLPVPGGTSGADETSFGEDGDGDDTGGPDGNGLDGDCHRDCGEGFCQLTREVPTCTCGEGWVLVGLTCVRCQPTDGAADIAIDAIVIDARIEVNGADAPAVDHEDGFVSLRSAQSGDAIVLGNSHDVHLSAAVLPGTYDVVWSRQSGGSLVPMNSAGVIGRLRVYDDGTIVPDAELDPVDPPLVVEDDRLVIDVRTTPLAGTFLFNGAPTPGAMIESGRLYLFDPRYGDRIDLGRTSDAEYAVRVLPGTYEVHYEVVQSSGTAPKNHDAFVTIVDVYEDEIVEVDIDVPVVNLSGAFSLDGATPPAHALESARIRLRDVTTGDEIVLGETSASSYSVPVVAGSYEVVYSHLAGTQLPRNAAAVLEDLSVAGQVMQHDIAITSRRISGDVLVAGSSPPTDPANVGTLSLRGSASDDEVALGPTANGSYDVRVIPGVYDVYYAQQTSSGAVPINTRARLRQSVDAESIGTIDVDVVSVAATVTLDGASPPTSEYDDGRIYLRNFETGDSVLLGNTRLADLTGIVVPGAYEIVYAAETPGASVPVNSGAKLGDVVLPAGGGPVALAIDIPAGILHGAITLASGASPTDADRANLVLQDLATDDLVLLAPFSAGSFATTLTSGTYLVWYESIESTGVLPANRHAGLACFTLTP